MDLIYLGANISKKKKNEKRTEPELSNFVGQSLFHLGNGTNKSKRIIKLQRTP
jgi:hypothetical protein